MKPKATNCILFLYLALWLSTNCFAQSDFKLTWIIQDTLIDASFQKGLQKKFSFKSERDRENEIKGIFFNLRKQGYLTASADSVHQDSTNLTLFISLGKIYKWAHLLRGNVDEEALSAVGYRDKIYRNRVFSPDETAQLLEGILNYEENNGFPFSLVFLDSLTMEGTNLSAKLQLIKNKRCTIDSFLVKGNAKISTYYLQRLIGIRKGDAYNEERIVQISKRIREIPFLSERKISEIYFSDKYTKLILYVDEKKANRFDGVLGFLPNETTGKLLVTGQLTLKLTNSFNKGEVIDVDWQKLQSKTQNLKTRLQIPFLFHSPFGADLVFKLYKRDTLYTDVNENIGLSYLIGKSNYLKVFYSNRSTSLISTRGLESLTTLPQLIDMNSKSYGLGFRTERLDYRLNPRKGFILDINGSVGTKVIKKNLKLKPIIYDGIDLKTNVYALDFTGELFIPIKRKSTIVLGNKSAWMDSKNLFTNELFRIGGLSSLRGFDEESINASLYTITKVEYRFLLDLNSYLFLFGNHAYYENRAARDSNNSVYKLLDNPYGFGAGITFETKPGIFSLSYALGKQFNNPISLRSAKIHFGIISTF